MDQILLRSQVPLRGLHGRMPQEQLDLFQLPAGGPAQLRACATKVVGRDSSDAGGFRVALEQLPDDLLAEGGSLSLAPSVDGAEHVAVANGGGSRPRVDGDLHPRRHRDCSHPAVFPAQVHDAPATVPLLDVSERQRRHLGAPQPTAQEYGQNRPVTEALRGGSVRRVQQRLRLPGREPVSKADALGGHALHARDAAGQFGRQQAVVGGFYGQLAHRRDPDVDGNGAQPAGLQRDAPGRYSGLREARPRFLAVPGEKFVQAEVVHPARNRGGDAIQHQGLEPLPLGGLRSNNQISHLGPLNGPYR
jgi:hypothetical protein